VRVDLTSATTVELVRTSGHDQAYRLRAGRVDVSVPHVPGESRRVEVITPDSVVKVRGTVFSVEVEATNGVNVTRVEVTRGSVGVEWSGQLHIVNAGDNWGSSAPKRVTSLEGSADVDGANTSARGELVEPNAAGRPAPARSSLRDQNQLSARALQAQRRGNHRL